MNAANRSKNLFKLLGWQGGTIHDACKEIGCDPFEFLECAGDFNSQGLPCHDFRRGYDEAKDIALYLSANNGNLQYWFGAVAAVENEFEFPIIN